MNKSYRFGETSVFLQGKVVTVIETIGEYDNIIRREFKTDEEAENYYKAQGGK